MEEQSVQFKLAPRPVEITSMTPDRGGPGTVVTLKGSGFGSIPKFTTVKFNGIAAEADTSGWSNTEIKLIVPGKAVTGPVQVINGDVKGDAGEFTVTSETTISGSFSYLTDSGFGSRVMSANMSFRLTGEILESFVNSENNYHIYDIKKGSPAVLTFTGAATLDTYEEKRTDSIGHTHIYTFREPKMVPFTDTESEDWPLNTRGSFPCSVSESGVSFTFDDFADGLAAHIVFEVYYDYKRYDKEGVLVEEKENQYYNARTIGIVSISAK